MKSPESNDPLDAMFREHEIYLDDAGFTARVMSALPPRRRGWLRPAILLGVALVGIALLIWWLPPLSEILVKEPTGTFALNLSNSMLLTLGAFLVAVMAVGWALFAAVKWED